MPKRANTKNLFDVISVGTATRDVFLRTAQLKVVRDPEHLKKIGFISGEAECFALGAKLEVEEPVLTIGGGAVNSAITFARHGFRAGCLITVGKDENGKAILKNLKEERIVILPAFSRYGTAYSTILIAPNTERTILVYRGAASDLRDDQIPWEKLRTKWVYISPGAIAIAVMRKLFEFFKKNKALIVFNPSGFYLQMGLEALTPFLNASSVVFMNQEEAALLTGLAYERERDIVNTLRKKTNCLFVITKGREGSLVVDRDNKYEAGIFKDQNPVDRTGAGDAFGSGFVSTLMKSGKRPLFDQKTILEAIRSGSANATAVIETTGANAGILTEKEYQENPRWKKLEIKISGL